MMLFDLCEPGQTPEPHARDKKIAIGIDLGTTNSLVALSLNHQPEIIRDSAGQALLPSIVSYREDGSIEVGQPTTAGATIRSVKRLMGRGFADIKKIAGLLPFDISMLEEDMSGVVRLHNGSHTVTPVEVSAEILRALKRRAEEQLDTTITQAVITVPAYFDDAARNATKDAAKLAGLEVLRLVNEPTAAALAYGLDQQSEGIYAVYDLGGGTFDVSLLRMEKGVFQVLATGGDASLGGDDIDAAIAETIIEQFRAKHNLPELTSAELQQLLSVARTLKETLSATTTVPFECTIGGIRFNGNFTRTMLEQLIAPMIQRTITIMNSVFDDAGVTASDVQGTVMVGGSTRIPAIRNAVATLLGKPPLTDVNPDEVVALGAALQAENLTGGGGSLLLDVLPLSLGLEIMGGMNEKIIHRNTPIPVAVAQEFTTYQDGQTGMQIHVVQGEREMVSDCRSLAHFELKNIPPMHAGAARVKLSFTVDADGLLTVSAQEETTGTRQEIAVKPSYGLREGEIERMLRDSMENARADVAKRLLTETKVETTRNVLAVEQALKEDGELLDAAELSAIEQQLLITRKALEGEDRDLIAHEMQQLDAVTDILVSKRMNVHIGKAFTGMSLEQLEQIADKGTREGAAGSLPLEGGG
jgi:molecular chaperone HscA